MITVVRLAAGQSGIYKKEKKKQKQIPVAVSHTFHRIRDNKTEQRKKETNKEERKRGNERKLIGEGKGLRCNAFGRR